MTIQNRYDDLTATLKQGQTRAEIMAVLADVSHAFGFDLFAITSMPAAADSRLRQHILESTIHPNYVAEFDAQEFLRDCPLFARLRGSILPISWAITDGIFPDTLPLHVGGLMEKYGLNTGIGIPVTSVDGGRFILFLCGTRAAVDPTEAGLIMIHALQVFDAYDRIRRRDMALPSPLSARELEVVKWTAQGKTSVEIGQILMLSDHTVNAYLTNAIRKLDCVNRTQLVAKALRLKLIV